MKFFTANLQLPNLKQSDPKKLIKLAETINTEKKQLSFLLDRIQKQKNNNYRLIEQIMQNIDEEKFANISLVEWVYCLSHKSEWDKLNPQKSQATSEKIWQFAQEYPPLKKRLFWHLVSFHFDTDEITLAPSLADTFLSFQSENKEDYITLKIINLLIKNNYLDLASLCVNQCLQPNELLHQYSLPYALKTQEDIQLVEKIQSYFPLVLNKLTNPQTKQINFLIDTLKNLSPDHQLIAVENLLCHISPQIAGKYPKLVNWVQNNYILTTDKLKENKLSSSSKLLFKKWLGAVNYQDFSQLIDLIIDRISVDYLEDHQLMTRKVFWSNYSDRFMRMRILLPFSTTQAFNNDFVRENISQLINDGSESTEVCIIDFNDYFIVEFFRGKGSETRIFAKNNQMGDELFNSPDISLKKLRYLPIDQTNIIDHCHGWQVDCEKVLRNQEILVNDQLQYFQIEKDQPELTYNFKTGLPPLNQQQIAQRNKELFVWQEDILQLEKEAKKYCQRQEKRWEIDSVLIFKNNQSLKNPKRSNLDFID